MLSTVPLQFSPIHHDITYNTVVTVAERVSNFNLQTDTPHLTASRVSYGVSAVGIVEKIEGVITAPLYST